MTDARDGEPVISIGRELKGFGPPEKQKAVEYLFHVKKSKGVCVPCVLA